MSLDNWSRLVNQMSCGGQSYVLCNVFHFISAFLSHFLIITIPHFIRQILQEKRWIPDKKYFVDPCFHQKLSLIEGSLPLKFVQSCSLSKLNLSWRSSSIEGSLPSKVVFHVRGWIIHWCYQMCSMLFFIQATLKPLQKLTVKDRRKKRVIGAEAPLCPKIKSRKYPVKNHNHTLGWDDV